MFIIYRYLLRQFTQIFLICFLSLMGLYVVVDAFQHLESFSAYSKTQGSLIGVMVEYYAYDSLEFFDRTSGMIAMLAAMFTVTWLQRHQEMTALMAAGVSKLRIVKPLIIAAITVSLAAAANREVVIPQVREQLARDSSDLGGLSARNLEPRFDNNDILVGGENVVVATRTIAHPNFILPRRLSQYGKQLTGRQAVHYPAEGDRSAGYLVDGVVAPRSLLEHPSLEINGRPVVMTPVTESWLRADQVFVVSNLSFTMLADGSTWKNLASTRELVAELNSPSTDLGPEVAVAVHCRLVQPLMDGTLLMLGLPLMLTRRNRNVFLTIGVCLLVALTFSLASLACQSLGGLGMLRPSLAAWLPLMAFVPLAAGMFQTVRT